MDGKRDVGAGAGRRKDGTAKILFDVIGLIRCCRACDRQGDVLLRFKLGGVNGLGIQAGGTPFTIHSNFRVAHPSRYL